MYYSHQSQKGKFYFQSKVYHCSSKGAKPVKRLCSTLLHKNENIPQTVNREAL